MTFSLPIENRAAIEEAGVSVDGAPVKGVALGRRRSPTGPKEYWPAASKVGLRRRDQG